MAGSAAVAGLAATAPAADSAPLPGAVAADLPAWVSALAELPVPVSEAEAVDRIRTLEE
ncbi:hypothetical protein F7P69_26145, partial [Cellulosimicrobium funkei]|nr:hypothetical protein [Cellulosimicrobium funkei]